MPPKKKRPKITRSTAGERREKIYKAMTPAERRKYPRCGRPNDNGRPCLAPAGSGTTHFGKGGCYRHQTVKELKPLEQVAADAWSMAKPIQTTPAMAMQYVLDLTFGQLVYAHWQVSMLDESEYWVKPKSGGHEYLNKHIRHLKALKHEMVTYAKAAGDLGVAERAITLAESQADVIVEYVKAVTNQLKLSTEQQAMLGDAIKSNLNMLTPTTQNEAVIDVLSQNGKPFVPVPSA